MGAKTFKTKTKDSTLNPVWNEVFEVHCMLRLLLLSIILILCTVGYFVFSSKKVIRERKAHFSETKGIGA